MVFVIRLLKNHWYVPILHWFFCSRKDIEQITRAADYDINLDFMYARAEKTLALVHNLPSTTTVDAIVHRDWRSYRP